MKLLLDENLPVKLKYRLIENGLQAYTIRDMQWLGKENGELLHLIISNNFTTFVTIDNNLSFQQNFRNYPCQVVVLVAPDNTYSTLIEFLPAIVERIKEDFKGAKVVIHPSHPAYNTTL